MSTTELTMETWEEKYNPLINHLDSNASFQNEYGVGIMYETYGDELAFVESKANENKVWTYVDTENGGTAIVAGMSWVNRIGYFVTEESWEDLDIFVPVSDGN